MLIEPPSMNEIDFSMALWVSFRHLPVKYHTFAYVTHI